MLYEVITNGQVMQSGSCVNLCSGGMFIETKQPPALEQLLHVEFLLPGTTRLITSQASISRITSYNVCYTKLLRHDELPGRTRVHGQDVHLRASHAELAGDDLPAGGRQRNNFV